VVVAPHPDDEVGCGGALLLHRRAGDETHVIVATDGRGSRAGGLGPDEMAARRFDEATAAGRLLGLRQLHWLGLREWEWDEAVLVAALGERLRATMPDVLYVPSRVDFHPEHLRVAASVAETLKTLSPRPPRLRVYQAQVPLTSVLVNLVAPIQEVESELLGAMRAYVTQFGSIERCHRMKRYAAARYGLRAYAEEFWNLDPAAYIRLHARAEVTDGVFRGVRRWPFSDPLAYLRGFSARRRLRKMVNSGSAA
jgi:LmbE family N-acetylglucosaminyl deacetylase